MFNNLQLFYLMIRWSKICRIYFSRLTVAALHLTRTHRERKLLQRKWSCITKIAHGENGDNLTYGDVSSLMSDTFTLAEASSLTSGPLNHLSPACQKFSRPYAISLCILKKDETVLHFRSRFGSEETSRIHCRRNVHWSKHDRYIYSYSCVYIMHVNNFMLIILLVFYVVSQV